MTLSKGGRSGLWAAASDLEVQTGPEGPPSNVSTYTYAGGTKWGLQWTNYDSSYYTHTSEDGVNVEHTVGPGITSRSMGYVPISSNPSVRHTAGGSNSAWVSGLPN
jgi:hypothetical protein